jgi:4-diphosphocytidyl-2-C-methyl-D-erythritol kinase
MRVFVTGFTIALTLASKWIPKAGAFAAIPSSAQQKQVTKPFLEKDSSKETLSFFSPCKINLFLRILRKREDGYHDLASLFQAIGFGDTLKLTQIDAGNTDLFTCNMEGVPTDSTNLVLRAIQLMRNRTGVEMYFDANLVKECPAQAGLGGGSANAATAMWGANEMMGRPATIEQVRGVV